VNAVGWLSMAQLLFRFVEYGLLVYRLQGEVFRHVPKECVVSSGYFHSSKSERRPKAAI